jgi:hypothetical protein
MGKVGHLVAVKIVETKSAVPNNFGIIDFNVSDRVPQTAVVSFKLFDPGMAVKIAILHQGDGRAMTLSADLRPGVAVRELPLSTVYPNSWTLIFMSLVLICVAFIFGKSVYRRMLDLGSVRKTSSLISTGLSFIPEILFLVFLTVIIIGYVGASIEVRPPLSPYSSNF